MEDPNTNDDGNNNQDDVHKDDDDVDDGDDDDTAFLSFIHTMFQADPLSQTYPEVFAAAPKCILQWRRRFRYHHRPAIWRRLFDKDKILKEFSEAAPVLDAVVRLVQDTPMDDTNSSSSSSNNNNKTFTIIDLASGKGYLSMILSELLPPEKIFRIVLMDKAWPMRNQPQPGPRHINWEHIYINNSSNDNDCENDNDYHNDGKDESKEKQGVPLVCQGLYADTPDSSSSSRESTSTSTMWPIQLDTSKQDLKHSRQLANIHKHYLSSPDHPVIILAIHLCGTLSLRAVQLFNGIGNATGDGEGDSNHNHVHFLALKPCCLPGMVHAKRKERFVVGNHSFPATDVCTHGKWKKKQWKGGPPRGHLKDKFQRWAHHLYLGIDDGGGGDDDDGGASDRDDGNVTITTTNNNNNNNNDSCGSEDDKGPQTMGKTESGKEFERAARTYKMHSRVMVQHNGGFQNDFLFAERRPTSLAMWQALKKTEVIESNIPFARTVT